MKRKNVHSSNIESIGYDEDAEILEVQFIGGGIYQYHGVDKKTAEELTSADSVGRFFHAKIRNGGYISERVDL